MLPNEPPWYELYRGTYGFDRKRRVTWSEKHDAKNFNISFFTGLFTGIVFPTSSFDCCFEKREVTGNLFATSDQRCFYFSLFLKCQN